MTITQADRFEMHSGLQQALGDNVANILMEHLPPSGWSDVARTRDIDLLREDMNGLEVRLRTDMNEFKSEICTDIREMNARLDHHTKWLIGIAVTYGAALLGTIVALVAVIVV